MKKMEFELDGTLKEWAKDKPLSVLQLDPADRAVLRIADERDAIQKKTFTKWVNKHLKKASRHVSDLFQDLRDGHSLISLLEVLSGEHLPRETSGSMRFHMLDNVRIALRFLQCKNIKLVNIQAEDIVDGNPKLTLGLIWTIILHFQISDIVVGQESHVTAKEALLRWARKSTARYPGVHVTDFTSSWRDGMAFSALLHRNRPDLLDWRSVRGWKARDRLEQIFNLAEHEYGVTRLLDPEDVDTPEPDEKSLITYISSLYDVFPEPPAIHPLYDAEVQRRLCEYRDLASSLHLWMREKISLAQDRHFPVTLIEMKKLLSECTSLKQDEFSMKQRDKQLLAHYYSDFHKYFESVGEIDLEPELQYENLDKNWVRLSALLQDQEDAIVEEIKRLEYSQRLAEKAYREIKTCETRLNELEIRINEEVRSKRILEHLNPIEAKNAIDILEEDMRICELQIQNIFADIHTLTEAKYSQAGELHKKVQKLHQRWVGLRSLLHKRLVQPLSSFTFPIQEERVVTKQRTTVHETRLVETNPQFRSLHDCIDWCKKKLLQISEADYGSDLASIQGEVSKHQQEHQALNQFQMTLNKFFHTKNDFEGEEFVLYSQHLEQLEKLYVELMTVSNKRLCDLNLFHDFIQTATSELVWLNSKEELELTRDWSDQNLNLCDVEQYYEVLMSDLEKRESQFSTVQDHGECLVLQHHPASKTIEAYLSAMQSQWAWLLQLTLCLEVHLKHTSRSQQFFKDLLQSEQWLSKKDETLNTVFSQSEFSLDEGEYLLKGMQKLREELNDHGDHVHKLVEQSKDIIPMKQRRQIVTRPLKVTSICNFKQVNMTLEKNEVCTLYDNSGRIKWRVKNSSGVESPVPGVCFSLQPPDKEAVDAAEKLKRQYEKSVALWQRKQLRLRQNMIFATIKVVKAWSLQQFLDMGQHQRSAIRKALNEDANKLLNEGDPSDPQLRRLKREMVEVNRLFDDFEKRARAEEESRHAGRIFNEQISNLDRTLIEVEELLKTRVAAILPRDLNTFKCLIVEHKDFEQSLQCISSDVEQLQQTFRSITLKTPQMKNKLDNIVNKWNYICNLNNLYIERLKIIRTVIDSLEENSITISEFENKLKSFEVLPCDVEGLQNTLEDLMLLQNSISQQQFQIDQLNDDAQNARRLVEKSRPAHRGPHVDMDRLDVEINKLNSCWTDICGQLVNKLRNAEMAYGIAQQCHVSGLNEIDFVGESVCKLEKSTLITIQDQEDGTIKKALKENFKQCEQSMEKFSQWLADIENKLAHQNIVQENIEDLMLQINQLKSIKEDIEVHTQPIMVFLDQIRQVVSAGSKIMSGEDAISLEKYGFSFKLRFDKVTDKTDKLLRKLEIARDELLKFSNEMSSFSLWLQKSIEILENEESSLGDLKKVMMGDARTRDFISDVIAHQADLRFITMAAQKFVDESKEYLKLLNDFRTSLPERFSFIEPSCFKNSNVRNEVSTVTSQYKDLLCRANSLSDHLSALNNRQRDYHDSLNKAISWIKELEPQVHKSIAEPVSPEPKYIENQLNKTKSIFSELISNERLINDASSSLETLLSTMKNKFSKNEIHLIKEPLQALEDKYKSLKNSLDEKCRELDTALVQCQGIQDTLENLVSWLNTAESHLKNQFRPASLQKERLEDQQREQRLLHADISSHQASIVAVSKIASELISSSSNSRVSLQIDSKLKDIQSRFEKLFDKSLRRGELLEEIATALIEFQNGCSRFNDWHAEIIELVELVDPRDYNKVYHMEMEIKASLLRSKLEDKRIEYENFIKSGKNLMTKKEITDEITVRDKIKTIESLWKQLNILIEEQQRLSKSCAERFIAYEKIRNQLLDWLNQAENSCFFSQSIELDLSKVKQQLEDLKSIQKEYRCYGTTVDKVNELGLAYDNLVRERCESPTRRRGNTSPTKKSLISSQLRRMSHDGRSPSPNKSGAIQSPVSPGDSSGFSSRRSSQDGLHLEELSVVQQQLLEINNRYGLLGVKLSDRQNELATIYEELKKYSENTKVLSQFLEKIRRQLPRDFIPTTKEDADKSIKQIKMNIEEMYEKQSLLENTKTQINELTKKRKNEVKGIDNLNFEFEDVSNSWKLLSNKCKDRIQFLEDLKEFYDTYKGLSAWLESKHRMLEALGPISSDPRMVTSQVQQVQVLREEFKTQHPQLDHLVDVSNNILATVTINPPDSQNFQLKLDNIVKTWKDQLKKLDERAQSLGDAVDTSREFDASLNRLHDALQGISDKLDNILVDNDSEEQLRKIENLERQLEGQRPLLADAEAAGFQLCEVLSDPGSKSDIQCKLMFVSKFYNNLQKKLDYKKAEIEANLRDERQFEASCSKTIGWLTDELGKASEKLLVSADRVILQQQLAHHEPIYRNVMSKEHEIIMLLNKGRDILARFKKIENRNLQRDLEKIQSQWDKLKKDTFDKQTKLQTCVEHCKKFYKVQSLFLPWLHKVEDKFKKLKPISYKQKDIEKQLTELSTFRNEVCKKSGEFENNISLGENLLAVCDVDKDKVKNEVSAMKSSWEEINNDLLKRIQTLEDTVKKLNVLNENIRDFEHALQRCEDKLTSHDAVGAVSKDPKFLEQVKNIRDEISTLKKPLIVIQQQTTDIVHMAREQDIDASHLQDDIDCLIDRMEVLKAKLNDRCSELQSAATAIAQFNETLRTLGHDLSVLEEELELMKPSGRDIKIVHEQIESTQQLKNKINRISSETAKLVARGENLVDKGFTPNTVSTREQIELFKKQLSKFDDRVHSRDKELNEVLNKLEQFWNLQNEIIYKIDNVIEKISKFKSVGSEVDSIRVQKNDFQTLKMNQIEPIKKAVNECNTLGQMLTQTAGRDVSTWTIEKDLEKMNEKWNVLKEKLNERDKKLDIGLLQSGKFQEALECLEKWLSDTEDMVANQKAPSSDYKVVKAQLQEQKFLIKMLLDRQISISSLCNMAKELADESEPRERLAIENQTKNLMGRFDNLSESAAERMNGLEKTMNIAKEFQEKISPLSTWLERTEKKIREMELIPTDEEKILKCVIDHNLVHEDILMKKNCFSELTDAASSLMTLVGEEEASALADKLQDVTDRYSVLVERSESLGSLLQRSKQSLRHLVITYQELQAWIEVMESRTNQYRVLAVHTDRILQQIEDLTIISEELSSRQNALDSTTEAGLELIKYISSDEALQLKEKLDLLQRRYSDLLSRGSEFLIRAQEALPLVQRFHDSHSRLIDWMNVAETIIQSAEPRGEEIIRLELEISDYRCLLDNINALGPQISQVSPGEGTASIEALVTRSNRRYDTIVEQIQRRAERIQLSKQRSLEVIADIEELHDWFREADTQLREAELPSSEPEIVRVQLKEHRALNDDISGQKGRVRDVLSSAKKVLRENRQNEDTAVVRNRMEELREMVETVAALSTDRLGCLEQALPLAEHLRDTHLDLIGWLEEAEQQISQLPMPALRADLIAAQQDRNELLLLNINEHRPLVDKLNKTGEALTRLTNEEEALKLNEIIESDNSRYCALRTELRARQQSLEQALQESALFSDKLEGMLRALSSTTEQLQALEPVSAHPSKLRDQLEDNQALEDELVHRSEALAAVKRAANDVINKAINHADPAVKDIKRKLDRLNKLWVDAQNLASGRSYNLQQTLVVAERFWSELSNIMSTLAELQDALVAQAPPAAEPKAIEQQQVALQEIRLEIDQTKPDVEHMRQSGQELMGLCGEPDKPEVRKHIEDLDQVWDNVTALYARREENLIDAMEKAMEFHGTLAELQAFLKQAETKYHDMKPLGSDIEEVKRQINELSKFKSEVDPHMVEVETLNRQAIELTERTTSEQAQAIKEPLGSVNRRWDFLSRGIVERQRLLENALLRLGQFQHALDELLVWIIKSERTLDELKVISGESQLIEIELAKLKVLVNDIQAHQTSVDTLNDAGRQLIEDVRGSTEASTTAEKLDTLNYRWRDLLQKAADRKRELEGALQEAQSFIVEIQDLLSWLSELDSAIVASKPVGGLPETASEQLERFMEIHHELEENRAKVETVLQQGKEYLRRGSSEVGGSLNHYLRNLKQRWDNVTARANDKRIKLEIALKEAKEFHDALQIFVNWLTKAEEFLSHLKPVSRLMEFILVQIEEHKTFQKDVGTHRESMLNLDKKGTHLKYFSQKQDVILIKNLLISVQHRWERVVSKSAERTRALDHGYKEAREFFDAWSNLIAWLEETEKNLGSVALEGLGADDPDKIKSRLQKHREIQKELSTKQSTYDSVIRNGKTLKDKAPKTDEQLLRDMISELKNKWSSVSSQSIERQRQLEEALLFTGQFKDAMLALLDWLRKAEKKLDNLNLLHGDLDTVVSLMEQHRNFENDLESRALQMDSVSKTGNELKSKANVEDSSHIQEQLTELQSLWSVVTHLSNKKSECLEEALKDADELHKDVHTLLEWLSDAEMRLRYSNQLPEDETESKTQLIDHEKFLIDLEAKKKEKDMTLDLAQTILNKSHPDGVAVLKHWISIIQSRWDEVAAWAQQRNQKLENHMQALQELDTLLEELFKWLNGLEKSLFALESEVLPDNRISLEMLISDHREFMENTAKRQDEVDQVCKARQVKPIKDLRKVIKTKPTSSVRSSPGREKTPDLLPHIGPRFPPKGSKGAEPEFRMPRVKSLWDKWRNVWMLAWERQQRLQDRLNYINELEKVANFSWEEWRKKFLKFMNHKKSRLTDLFRKMDKNNDGLIPRDDFIQGILNTKFDTSRMEMGAVADLFDRHGEGLIDWKEFIAALRPDWEERRIHNDTDKIHDEVKRLVMLCTCRQKFRVFQVGEGKYRFGDSQKLRLVRILRSTVMVRVGGGWVALDEFLVKNDPCRAKGRTNIELREQFILADGVSQTMTAFRSKPSPTSSLLRNSLSMAGPITKVRERSVRSVPMGQPKILRASSNTLTPDSLSDNEGPSRHAVRKTSVHSRSTFTPGGSRSSSRPSSRPGSKPSSRYGSTQSLDSTDESTMFSRIPRRTGLSGNTPISSRRNSTSGKKLNTTTTNGSNSRPRTPTGLISPSIGTPSRLSSLSRASSIPTLAISGILSGSRVNTSSSRCDGEAPYIADSDKKSREQSDIKGGTSLQRRVKQSPSTDQRAPFRL